MYNPQTMEPEYGVYPFRVQILLGRFTPQKVEISSDGQSVTLEIFDENTKDTMLLFEPDEIPVLIETLKLFQKRIEQGIPTITTS